MQVTRIKELPRIGSSFNFVGADHDANLSIFFVEADPNRGAPLHFHDYDETMIILEGRSRVVLGNETHETSPGEIFVIKAGTPHGFLNIGEVVLKQIDVHEAKRFAQVNLPPTDVSLQAGLPVPKS